MSAYLPQGEAIGPPEGTVRGAEGMNGLSSGTAHTAEEWQFPYELIVWRQNILHMRLFSGLLPLHRFRGRPLERCLPLVW